MSRTRKPAAFTLLELIVVVVVLGILAAIAVPTFSAVIDRSHNETTLVSLKSIAHEAQALEGFDRNGWGASDDVEPAIDDLEAGALSTGVLAGEQWRAVPYNGSDPAPGDVVYRIEGPLLLLSMRSGSGSVCAVGSTYTDVGKGSCSSEGSNRLSGLLATQPTEVYPAGSAPTTTPPAEPAPPAATAPSAPTGVSGAPGDGQVTVSFTPGAEGSAPVTYTATASPGGKTSSGPSSPLAVSDLTNGTAYTFVVTASNTAGTATSEPSSPVTPAAPAVDISGTVSTLAGNGTAGYADGSATTASFSNPNSLASDGTYMYVADISNDRIRKVHLVTGETTTLAGDGVQRSVDGTGTAASFYGPYDLVADAGYLYVSEFHGNRIRKVEISTGTVSTLAGTGVAGGADGPGASATFHNPGPIAIRNGTLYVADTTGAAGFRTINLGTGAVSTLAASLGSGVKGLAVDADYLYYTSRSAVRRYEFATGFANVFVGASTPAGYLDASGTNARFNSPAGLELSAGSLYVADQNNHRVRKVDIASKAVTTVAGTGAASSVDGPAGTATLNGPSGLTSLGEDLYVTEVFGHKIRKVS